MEMLDIEALMGGDWAHGSEGPERDQLDETLEVWAREIPDLDPLTEGIIERIQILGWNFNQSLDETLEEYELDRRAFSLLGKLRRHGAPYQVSAGKLAADLRLSSGAMTNRLDRMEAAGLVRRLPDPNDRRGTLVEPTELGPRRRGTRRSAPRRAARRCSSVPQRRREGAAPRPPARPDARLPGLEAEEAHASPSPRRTTTAAVAAHVDSRRARAHRRFSQSASWRLAIRPAARLPGAVFSTGVPADRR